MNKKALLLALVAMTVAGVAQAAESYTSAGCGLGTILFEGKKGKVHLVLAATTNGTFGNQTFGISSETLGCSADGVVKNDKKLEVFAAVNLPKLSAEMARGGGETLAGLGSLLGVKDQKAFFELTQARYEKIFPEAKTDSAAMLRNIKAELATL